MGVDYWGGALKKKGNLDKRNRKGAKKSPLKVAESNNQPGMVEKRGRNRSCSRRGEPICVEDREWVVTWPHEEGRMGRLAR